MNSDGWMTVKQFLKGHNSTTLFRFFSGNDDEQWLNNMLFGLHFFFFNLRFKQNKSLYLNGTVLFWQL